VRTETVQRLLSMLRTQRVLVAWSAAFRIVNQGLGVAIPAVAVGLVVAVAGGSADAVGALAVLAGLALIKGLFRYLEQYTGHAVAFRLLARLRSQVFGWLERLEPATLQDERSGDLVARASGDIDRVEPFYAHTIAPVLAAVVVPVVTLVGLGLVANFLVVLALAPFVLLYLVVVPLMGWRGVAKAGAEVRRASGEMAASIADVVQGGSEVAVLGAGDQVLERLRRAGHFQASRAQALAESSARRSLAGGLISAAAIIAVTVVAVGSGLPVQALAVAVVLAWTVMTPLRALEQILPDTEQSLAAAGRLFDLEDRDPQLWGDQRPAPSEGGRVRFESVTVRSSEGTLIEDVDLEVPDGAFLALVGPSGSGKSTLVHTLARVRDPDSGRVVLAGRPVVDWAPSTLSAAVAMVPQRPDFFYGSLASNLRIARREANDTELMAALERAQLVEWVASLDEGLETHLGEGGLGMSGGQLQRLAVARAFLRDPAVLVLDEATSDLDVATERALLDEVYADRGRRTLIVVAHRMETVIDADQIAVLDHGRVVELGSHDELERAGGIYTALWRRHLDVLVEN
jgi:ATP-binding cassette, subfamily C, bacterial CydC